MDGLLLVDKHPGCTSHDVVQQVRRALGQKRVGHCGTLDPAATGLLLLTLGHATRLTRFLISAPKVYTGVVRFGVSTNTYDADGEVVETKPTAGLEREAILREMAKLEGTYEQTPPPYCARKVNGVKFYELARRGEDVPEVTKEVTVYEFRPTSELADDRLEVRIGCTSGTYVRTLAHDLGAALGCGAHLEALRREQIGHFKVADALPVAELARRRGAGEDLRPAWIPFDEIPLPFGEVTADVQQERRIVNGQTVLVRELGGEEGDWVKLCNRRAQFIGVGTVIERIGANGVGVIQPRIVFR